MDNNFNVLKSIEDIGDVYKHNLQVNAMSMLVNEGIKTEDIVGVCTDKSNKYRIYYKL